MGVEEVPEILNNMIDKVLEVFMWVVRIPGLLWNLLPGPVRVGIKISVFFISIYLIFWLVKNWDQYKYRYF